MFLPPAFSFCVDFFNIYFPSLCLQVRPSFLCNVDPIRGIFHSDVVVRIPELHSGSLSHPVSLLPTPRPSRKLRRGLVRRVCDISAGPGEGSAERGLLRPRSDPSSFLPLLRPGKSSGLGPSAPPPGSGKPRRLFPHSTLWPWARPGPRGTHLTLSPPSSLVASCCLLSRVRKPSFHVTGPGLFVSLSRLR